MTTVLLNKQFNEKYVTVAIFASVLVVGAITFLPDLAHAVTDVETNPVKGQAEFKGIYDNLKGLLTGYVGLTIALVSALFGAVSLAGGGSWRVLLPTFGTSTSIVAGPSILEGIIGAIF